MFVPISVQVQVNINIVKEKHYLLFTYTNKKYKRKITKNQLIHN